MRLIDADEMLKRRESWNTDDVMDKALYNFTLNRIIEQTKVDAIPIEWINHYMDTNLTKVSLFYSCMSEFVRDWQKEQEKNNGNQ